MAISLEDIKTFNYGTWSRGMAIITGVIMSVVGVLTMTTTPSNLAWMIFFVVVIFSAELPFCCSCCCPKMVERLKPCEASKENPKGAVFRGVLYIAMAVVGCIIAVNIESSTVAILLYTIMVIDGVFYLAAFVQDSAGKGKGLGGATNADLAGAAGAAAKKKAKKYAKENPDQVKKAAKAAGKYAAENPEVAKEAVKIAVADDNPFASSGSSGVDKDEDNPFM